MKSFVQLEMTLSRILEQSYSVTESSDSSMKVKTLFLRLTNKLVLGCPARLVLSHPVDGTI